MNEVINRTGRKGKDDEDEEDDDNDRDRGIDRSPPPKPPGTDGMIWDPNTMEWRYPRPGEVPLVYDPETNTWHEPVDENDVPRGCQGARSALTEAENELARLRLLADQARNKLGRAEAIQVQNEYKAHLLLGWDAGSLIGGGVTAPVGVGVGGSVARQMDNWVPPASLSGRMRQLLTNAQSALESTLTKIGRLREGRRRPAKRSRARSLGSVASAKG